MSTKIYEDRIRTFVAALRSGRYKQGKSALQYVDEDGTERFCCLGVACEVAVESLPELKITDYLDTNGFKRYAYNSSGSTLPRAVYNWYGLFPDNPRLVIPGVKPPWWKFWQKPVPDRTVPATVANDAWGLSFEQIADAFEYTYLSDHNPLDRF